MPFLLARCCCNDTEESFSNIPPANHSPRPEKSQIFEEGKTSFSQFEDELPPLGDYSKLRYIVRASKKSYRIGEPIFFKTFVKNESDKPVNIRTGGWSLFASTRIALFDENNKPSPLTVYAKAKFKENKEIFEEYYNPFGVWCLTIPPGKEIEIAESGGQQLNVLFDMTLPGEYRATFYRKRFIEGQAYRNFLASNEVIVLVETHASPFSHDFFVTPKILDAGKFDNPTPAPDRWWQDFPNTRFSRLKSNRNDTLQPRPPSPAFPDVYIQHDVNETK